MRCISLFLSAAVFFLAGCQAKLSLIEGTQPTKVQLENIKRVSVESSVGELEVVGPNFVVKNVMAAGVWMEGTLVLCLPCMIGTLAIGSVIASGVRSSQENEARGMIPTSWIEGEMTERFQRRLTEAKLFDVVAAASSDAVILLRLDNRKNRRKNRKTAKKKGQKTQKTQKNRGQTTVFY